MAMEIEAIGKVLRQPEGDCILELRPEFIDGLDGVTEGRRLQVLYWMHELTEEDRKALKVHPRGDSTRPLTGVFALRSPMRPNPIGVSDVQVTRIAGNRVFVADLDALDGSPILDVKGSAS